MKKVFTVIFALALAVGVSAGNYRLAPQNVSARPAALSAIQEGDYGGTVKTGYLLRENFTNSALSMEGWEIRNIKFGSTTSLVAKDNKNIDGYIRKKFAPVERVSLEFKMMRVKDTDGARISLNGADGNSLVPGAELRIKNNQIYYTDGAGVETMLCAFSNMYWTGIKIEADITEGVRVFVNGASIIASATLTNAVAAFSQLFIGYDAVGSGTIQFGTVYAHTGYALNEMFLTNSYGSTFDPNADYARGLVPSTTYSDARGRGADNSADANKLTDGSDETVWRHINLAPGDLDGVYIIFNLGSLTPINAATIKFAAAYRGRVDITIRTAGQSWSTPYPVRYSLVDVAADGSYSFDVPSPTISNTPIVDQMAFRFYKDPGDDTMLAGDVLSIATISLGCTVDVIGARPDFSDDWTRDDTGGTVKVKEYYPYKPALESNVLELNDTDASVDVRAEKAYAPLDASLKAEFKMMQESEGSVTRAVKAGSDYIALNTSLTSGKNVILLEYKSGTNAAQTYEIYEFQPGMWYTVQLVYDRDSQDITVNVNGWAPKGAIAASGFDTAQWDAFSVTTSDSFTGKAYVDDIKVYAKPAATTVPVPVPADTGNTMVTMQACTLWREGSHLGWETLNRPEMYGRKPILGWYDEGNPEVADWEIKFAAEHGINNMMYCWYRSDTAPGPIMNSRLADQLWEGYFNSEYKDYMKFSMMLTNNAGFASVYDYADLMNNVMPYFIEVFFKNPNYARTADGKPIFYIYDAKEFYRQIGDRDGDGIADAKDAKLVLDEMRRMCVDAGFPGLYIACEYRADSAAQVAEYASSGYDYIFAYTWHPEEYNMTDDEMLNYIKTSLLSQRSGTEGTATQIIPNISKSWDTRGWADSGFSPEGKVYSFDLEHYRQENLWIKEVFGPATAGTGELQTKLVMLDNWNEYSEGHWLFPTYGTPAYKDGAYAFGYLDVIRETFSRSVWAHDDILPLEAGYGPYDSLFPNGWSSVDDEYLDHYGDENPDGSVKESGIADRTPGTGALAGETVFNPAVTSGSVQTINAADAVRVVIDKVNLDTSKALAITMKVGVVTLEAAELAKIAPGGALDIVFAQLNDVSEIAAKIKTATSRAKGVTKALAYTVSATDIGTDRGIRATVSLMADAAAGEVMDGNAVTLAASKTNGRFSFDVTGICGFAQVAAYLTLG
jgi:hypothetical protein